jgi:hypothetical protein
MLQACPSKPQGKTASVGFARLAGRTEGNTKARPSRCEWCWSGFRVTRPEPAFVIRADLRSELPYATVLPVSIESGTRHHPCRATRCGSELSAPLGSAGDLLDRHTWLGQVLDNLLLPWGLRKPSRWIRSAQVSSAGSIFARRKRLTDGRHRSPDRLEERGTGVLHQMPAVGELHGLRRSLGRGLPVTAAAVTRDNVRRHRTQSGGP